MPRLIRSLLATACAAAVLTAASGAANAAAAESTAKAKVDCTAVKCIALTFDDGPGKYAGELLDTLKKHKAKATFFLQGQYVKSRPTLAKRIAQEGHELGNHSYSHKNFTNISIEDINTEVTSTQDVVHQVTGKRPTLLRPPYGLSSPDVEQVATELKLPIILWNAGSRDWALRDTKAITKQVLSVAERDAVVLMHDWVPQTVQAMPEILTELTKQGYALVSASEVLGDKLPAAGETYRG
ncbi:Peptidoglycan/xylan/chitin deacetylase, PgdA/CDA1 family [Sinosporangium album]|uniref:Peptidoglycan/xylan/chitin deacetylase, PgdA/CDA1 family n=1 Tax=Sinosporangium album TaxID=504805 RepID=A0A1G8BE13_9ACTN|nr:polysaccharide deacetylase family protein [Sinosporangium album]SDH31492.1 Peptidoglycan/xylan/chitin deacetylase, PgdA/CDA1 family [Sinosporangium album]